MALGGGRWTVGIGGRVSDTRDRPLRCGDGHGVFLSCQLSATFVKKILPASMILIVLG